MPTTRRGQRALSQDGVITLPAREDVFWQLASRQRRHRQDTLRIIGGQDHAIQDEKQLANDKGGPLVAGDERVIAGGRGKSPTGHDLGCLLPRHAPQVALHGSPTRLRR